MTARIRDLGLGFAGMILSGMDAQEAYEHIRAESLSPEVQRTINRLRATPEGKAALEWSRQQWAERGFPPPWEERKDSDG